MNRASEDSSNSTAANVSVRRDVDAARSGPEHDLTFYLGIYSGERASPTPNILYPQ